jgi:lipoyl-dependent peroxiredoxin
MKRLGICHLDGGLHEGKGSVSTECGALETYPYTFFSRYDEKPGRAAWGGSRRLFHHVVRQTARHGGLCAGASRQQIGSRHRQGRRWLFHHLGPSHRHRQDPGIDQAAFQSIAAKAKAGCPVSKLMKVDISSRETALKGCAGSIAALRASY